MDLLKLSQEKIEVFANTESYLGLQSVISHIEIAERHLTTGKAGDDYLYTDVIYRTNQAFEGSLKEAYTILAGKSSEKKTPYQIEKYLEDENLLKERVLSLFSNYRTEWRNKSTHDYKLYFSEQEAFLAIVSITAFFNILLDQMIEVYAYEKERRQLKIKSEKLTSPTYPEQNFLDQVVELLKKFAESLQDEIIQTNERMDLFEREIIGRLLAYLNAADSEIEVFSEYAITIDSKRAIADFLLIKNKVRVLIEVKRSVAHVQRRRRDGREQLLSYMVSSEIEQGVLFITPLSSKQEIMVKHIDIMIGNSNKTIVEIYPENLRN